MGLRQSFRPKHQVLVQKCYPQYTKSTTEVKPNSSELSYLLYYASTRRSKLWKVGAYLEKRTISDVGRGKLGNVQVTLQIVTALIDKCPRDLALYSSYVLNILSTVLHSGDINFIEESVQTFAALCKHLDHAGFSADPLQTRQYNDIVSSYAKLASTSAAPNTAIKRSLPETLRLRTAGLKAINSLVSAVAFDAHPAQLKIVVPTILEQLTSDDPHYIRRLEERETAKDKFEKAQTHRRRPSLSAQKSIDIPRTPRPADSSEADPMAAAGTAADSDERTAEEIGVLALQTLRTMFSSDNRGQIRGAIALTVTHALDYAVKSNVSSKKTPFLPRAASPWLTDLFSRICDWTPVQDRFIILIVMVESLTHQSSPTTDADRSVVYNRTARQQHLAPTITHLLRSDHNFIGLSVLDVLIGILDTIRLGGPPLFLAQLRDCTGALAGHIYYGDQIADMVSAIVPRLHADSDMSRACVQEVLDAARTDLQSLRLSPQVRAELGLEVVDANSTGKSGGSGSKSGSDSLARRAAEREALWRNGSMKRSPLDDVASSDSGQKAMLGVDDLKKALAGVYSPARPMSSIGTGSDSMMSGDFSASEVSLPMNGNGHGHGHVGRPANATAFAFPKEVEGLHHGTPPPPLDTAVPPVPTLPAGMR